MKPTPLMWLGRMSGALYARQAEMQEMDDFYSGLHPLPFLTRAHEAKLRNEFLKLLEDSKANFMRLVVDAVEERLRVEGFRLSASTEEAADRDAWLIWQANQMDAQSQVAFVETLVKGVSYLSVWREKPGESPTIAVEDPMQTIVAYEPGSNYRRRAAALKLWTDEWSGMERANVYLPDGIFKFERKSGEAPAGHATTTGNEDTFGETTPGGASGASALSAADGGWKELETEAFVRNPLGVVPIVPLRNRPRLRAEGESELADVFRIQNQINGFLFLLALAGYFGAHRQRWAVGLTIHEDKDGKPVEPFNVAVDRLIFDSNPDARFGEFQQTDLAGYIKAIEQKVLHIAVTTRTPRHYLIEQGQSPSGDAIKSAESGLVKKIERKQRTFGEGLEEAMRLARMFAGEKQAPEDSEVIWADAEVRSEGEITDAAIKRYQGGIVPWRQTVEDVGYSQVQIERMEQQRAQEQAPTVEQEQQQRLEVERTVALDAQLAQLAQSVGRLEQRPEPTPPAAPNITVEAAPPAPAPVVTIAEGAIQVTLADGAVRTEIAEGAVKVDTTVEAPPPAQVTVDAPITVQSPPRVKGIQRSGDGSLDVTYDDTPEGGQ